MDRFYGVSDWAKAIYKVENGAITFRCEGCGGKLEANASEGSKPPVLTCKHCNWKMTFPDRFEWKPIISSKRNGGINE